MDFPGISGDSGDFREFPEIFRGFPRISVFFLRIPRIFIFVSVIYGEFQSFHRFSATFTNLQSISKITAYFQSFSMDLRRFPRLSNLANDFQTNSHTLSMPQAAFTAHTAYTADAA